MKKSKKNKKNRQGVNWPKFINSLLGWKYTKMEPSGEVSERSQRTLAGILPYNQDETVSACWKVSTGELVSYGKRTC